MTTTYAATNAAGPVAAHGQAGAMQVEYAIVNITTAPVINDILQFFTLPPNARIHSAVLKASDMDSSTGILIDIGDAGSATRYFSSSTVGQAGTVDSTMAAGGRFYKTTAKTAIVGLIHTAPSGTGATGTCELAISYIVEDSATS